MLMIRAFPRIHTGLLDVGHITHRRIGGAGFTLSGPSIEIMVEPSKTLEVAGLEKVDDRAKEDIERVLNEFQKISTPLNAKFSINQMIPQHIGLGSKTALLLAFLKAADEVSDSSLPMRKLQLLSARGGTSGIGINTFFHGGFLTDGGHEQTNEPFLPSNMKRPTAIPPVLCRLSIPSNWRFTLLLTPKETMTDYEFLRKYTPLSKEEVLDAVALTYHGIVPAVAIGDLSLLKTSLDDLHRSGIKKYELGAQSKVLQDIYRRIRERQDVAVMHSSIGPGLCIISEKGNTNGIKEIKQLPNEFRCKLLGTFEPRNNGFEIIKQQSN
jgi:beta-ribofuranosylaminobenzene 5'-phosphate synthase